eukprot:8103598-Ditylum_brightwellii.AAC.1
MSEEHMLEEADLPPHIYSIANNTFCSMISKLEDSNFMMPSASTNQMKNTRMSEEVMGPTLAETTEACICKSEEGLAQ